MHHTPPILSLHLRYRLWIAELNSDITILRILEDFLNEARSMNIEEAEGIADSLDNLFIKLRKEIDDLRHEMHLLKMKLAACLRECTPLTYKTYLTDRHIAVKKRYYTFRKMFEKAKADIKNFENRCLEKC